MKSHKQRNPPPPTCSRNCHVLKYQRFAIIFPHLSGRFNSLAPRFERGSDQGSNFSSLGAVACHKQSSSFERYKSAPTSLSPELTTAWTGSAGFVHETSRL